MGSGKGKGRKQRDSSPASSTEKGAVVEKIVAMMHEAPGVEVRRDVRLPAKNDSSRQRQFDVLLIGNVAGYSRSNARTTSGARMSARSAGSGIT